MKKHLKNIVGIIAAFCIFIFGTLFAIWQWDIIVTGCVWWEASPTGQGWHWDGPGAYARAPFQCFLWRTTIGRAYDTLLTIMFLAPLAGMILLFVSLWFWND